LAVLCGSIFANDLTKLIVHYYNHLRDCYRRWCQRKRLDEKFQEETNREIILEMDQSCAVDDLDDALERVYFKLVKSNANKQK